MSDRLTALSKTLAYVLRHRPASVGIELDGAGWVDASVLVSALVAAGHRVDRSDLEQILRTTGKQRYETDDAGRIRAVQGHSVVVDLGLEPTAPPQVLYHGTVDRFLVSILSDGLRPGSRHHVHLSAHVKAASTVGERRGVAVVLTVEASRMHVDGHAFFLASNGVWLVEHVPPQYLSR